jgi:hypothetical protein
MDNQYPADAAAAGAAGLVVLLIQLAFLVLIVASLWRVFTKAGQPGWAAIVPIYNMVVLLQIINKPIWWILLFLIPLVNIVISIITMVSLATVFGRGVGFAIGLIFLPFIFLPILAFSDSEYEG